VFKKLKGGTYIMRPAFQINFVNTRHSRACVGLALISTFLGFISELHWINEIKLNYQFAVI
jgi:hypothetical protein